MKKVSSNVSLFFLLVAVSLLLYLFQLAQFDSPRDTVFYFIQDMAFLPLQVAIVTVVLNRILSAREKQERLKKMNMVISAFFSEAGTDIIKSLIQFNTNKEVLQSGLDISGDWTNGDFQKAIKLINSYDFKMDIKKENLEGLKVLLLEKRYFLLSMLENSNLLEHDTFTDMLWAVFHLTDELVAREAFADLPDSDINHLANDIIRAFSRLIFEWVNYIIHLKSDYPYLFSMAVRKNPFNENSSPIVR